MADAPDAVELACSVYVHGPGTVDDLRSLLAAEIGSTVRRASIDTTELVIGVHTNDYWQTAPVDAGPFDPAHFRYILDVEPTDPAADLAAGLRALTEVLAGLGRLGVSYQVSGDVEELLPNSGRSLAPPSDTPVDGGL